MITSGEINKIAAKLKLQDKQIEKDYVIGWILKGISENEFLKEKLIFKGGTAIRKIYIKDYRLSEDLDFSYSDNILNISEIDNNYDSVCSWVKDISRIDLKQADKKENSSGNYSFYLEYTGPLGGSKNSVKVDISCDEKICDIPDLMEAINEYSDLSENYFMKTYSINEILSEKMRALMQRTAPRDLYDLWYFFEIENKDIVDFIPSFKVKTEYKNLKPEDFVNVINKKMEIFKRAWKNQLENQINDLPDFIEVWRKFNKHLRKFEKNI
ncbi:MAG: nucleotidyl transferase AbiEii/AbiGii toxin family protein [Ignavibacteria bacterium]